MADGELRKPHVWLGDGPGDGEGAREAGGVEDEAGWGREVGAAARGSVFSWA